MPNKISKNGLLVRIVAGVLAVGTTLAMAAGLALSAGARSQSAAGSVAGVQILDKYDMFMTNEISKALEGVLDIEKSYWLSDRDQVAPKPDPDNYGTAETKAELDGVIAASDKLLEGQELLFQRTAEEDIWDVESIRYYQDETILVITWKQVIDRSAYTISEVVIADPSQFRRFLAGGEFGSDKQYTTTEMASSVNAVVATSGDFYKFRRNGVVVYDGELQRFEGKHVDTCYINDAGDLLFTYRGELKTEDEAKQFIEENNVRFSLAFGPVLVDEGVACAPASYTLGEINDEYSRAAVCQMGELHYLFVNLCGEPKYKVGHRATIQSFAKQLEALGVDKAYALDGGQTTVIAMDGQLVSYPDFGTQRDISDIIYFATALPNGG